MRPAFVVFNKYYSGVKTGDEMDGTGRTHVRIANAYKMLDSKPEGMRVLGKPKHRWK